MATRYCNENVKLRQGGRKAPLGGMDKLKELSQTDNHTGVSVDWKFRDFLFGDVYEDPKTGKKTDFSKIAAAFNKDISKYEVDMENTGDATFGTTKHGIDYITTWMGGDWECPAQIFIYWDGKNYRGYFPTKGNCINTINKMAFGNDEDEDNKYCQKEFGLDYCDVYDDLDIDFAACLEDFEARLEVDGGTPSKKTADKIEKIEKKLEYSSTLTSPEESLELIDLGLSVTSADLLYRNPFSQNLKEVVYIDEDPDIKDLVAEEGTFTRESAFIPAWSMSRMIDLFLKAANTDNIKVDYVISGGKDRENMKTIAFENLKKQLKKK